MWQLYTVKMTTITIIEQRDTILLIAQYNITGRRRMVIKLTSTPKTCHISLNHVQVRKNASSVFLIAYVQSFYQQNCFNLITFNFEHYSNTNIIYFNYIRVFVAESWKLLQEPHFGNASLSSFHS